MYGTSWKVGMGHFEGGTWVKVGSQRILEGHAQLPKGVGEAFDRIPEWLVGRCLRLGQPLNPLAKAPHLNRDRRD